MKLQADLTSENNIKRIEAKQKLEKLCLDTAKLMMGTSSDKFCMQDFGDIELPENYSKLSKAEQDHYAEQRWDIANATDCDTVGCIAGWMNYTRILEGLMIYKKSSVSTSDGIFDYIFEGIYPHLVARSHLHDLFYGYGQLWKFYCTQHSELLSNEIKHHLLECPDDVDNLPLESIQISDAINILLLIAGGDTPLEY